MKKHTKKLISLLLSLVFIVSTPFSAFAATSEVTEEIEPRAVYASTGPLNYDPSGNSNSYNTAPYGTMSGNVGQIDELQLLSEIAISRLITIKLQHTGFEEVAQAIFTNASIAIWNHVRSGLYPNGSVSYLRTTYKSTESDSLRRYYKHHVVYYGGDGSVLFTHNYYEAEYLC